MRKTRFGARSAAFCTLLLPVAGCMADATGSPEEGDGEIDSTLVAPELIRNSRGREFRRKDMWDPAELDVMNRKAIRALHDSPTLEEVADGLRGQMIGPGGRIYVEVEPNMEMAASVLADMQGTTDRSTSPGASEARRVFGSDTRVNSSSTSGWQASIAFQEAGDSGTRIGAHTMVTAAHTIYTPFSVGGSGWNCRDGSVSTTGCSSYPRWRFGVNGTSGHSNWISIGTAGCTATVPTAFMNLDWGGSGWTFARYDYAVVDLSGCSSSLFPNGRVWFGVEILSNSQLSALSGHNAGFPNKVPCPDLGDGSGIDCPNGIVQYSGTGPMFTGAELFTSTSSAISAGDSQSAYTIKSTIDSTMGQSGGPMYKLISNGDHFLIGWLSNNSDSTNRYRRWTSGMFDWVSENSTFPDDN